MDSAATTELVNDLVLNTGGLVWLGAFYGLLYGACRVHWWICTRVRAVWCGFAPMAEGQP